MVFHELLPAGLYDLMVSSIPYIVILVAFVYFIKKMTAQKKYGERIIEIKEAPLELSNLLKDSAKRRMLRSLRKEKKYVSAISKEINDNAPRTRYHLKQLEKSGLVKSFKLAREAYFFVTKKGEWAVAAIDYYYPQTNWQLIYSRIKRMMGFFEIKRLLPRNKGTQESV